MPLPRAPSPLIRQLSLTHGLSRSISRPSPCWRLLQNQTRSKHNTPRSNQARVPISKRVPNNVPRPQDQPSSQELPQYFKGSPKDGPLAAINEGDQSNEDAILRQVYEAPHVKVKYVRPAIWALSVSAGIYALLAYLEAREETKPAPAPQLRRYPRRESATPSQVLSTYWNTLDPISKLSFGIIATNGAVHLSSFLAPRYWSMLAHIPAMNANYSLFTSTFVHYGPLHFFVNMWACYQFLLPTGYSPLFEGNPYHALSFFLSAGVLSGYGQHFSTIFSNQVKSMRAGQYPSIFVRSGGASGALFGVFGAFCMQYPDAGVGIIFIPFSVAASTFLPCVMAFDLYGMVVGFKSLRFGHAAHLSGALLGVGYSYFDGKNLIWKPLVRFFRRNLQKQRS